MRECKGCCICCKEEIPFLTFEEALDKVIEIATGKKNE